ncbi:hypothetical protein [Nitratireductor sp. GZWM139]|uniref:hypothetical protein n=1 Tax=Nitratireductor sp. GZWM139 TaxID=2950541 RepID=UPI0024BF00A9|nr:hypothetical protein [Nitratireductor sp. GZWM139]MDJ1464741.1 hypothetical protein [Nitratireductor sp. GZWM139]
MHTHDLETLPEDMQAHAIATALETIAAAARAGVSPESIARMAERARERAEALVDYLDPTNWKSNGRVPLYPELHSPDVIREELGANVIAFRRINDHGR